GMGDVGHSGQAQATACPRPAAWLLLRFALSPGARDRMFHEVVKYRRHLCCLVPLLRCVACCEDGVPRPEARRGLGCGARAVVGGQCASYRAPPLAEATRTASLGHPWAAVAPVRPPLAGPPGGVAQPEVR